MFAHDVPVAQNLSPHCPVYHPKRRGYGGVPPCFPIVLDLCRCRVFPEKRVWGQSAPTLRKARGLPLPPAGVSGFCQNAPGKLGFCSLLLYTIIGKFESFFLFYIYGYSPHLQNSHTAFSLLRRACRTRMTEQQNLSALHAKLKASLPKGKCSHRPRRPGHILFPRKFILISQRGMGREPHVYPSPLTFAHDEPKCQYALLAATGGFAYNSLKKEGGIPDAQ